METTLTISVFKNDFWSLCSVKSVRRAEYKSRSEESIIADLHFCFFCLCCFRSRVQLNSKGSTAVAAFFGLRFFAVSD